MKTLSKIYALILSMFCVSGNFYAEASETRTDINIKEVENYMAILGELQG